MKFLVIGLGSMGKRRIRCLKALGYSESDIAGVDLRKDRRKEANDKYQVDTYDDFALAIKNYEPDALIISVPPDLHHVFMKAAIKHELPFFVEASVVDTGMSAIIQQAKEASINAVPSATMMFHPAIKMIKQKLDDNVLGKISNITFHSGQYLPDWHTYESVSDFYVSNKDTGGAREITPFELTWITQLFGFPERLSAVYKKTTDIEGAETIDDTYSFLLEYNSFLLNGMVDVVSRSATRKLLINGEKKQLTWDWNKQAIEIYDPSKEQWEEHSFGMKEAEEGYDHRIGENMYINEIRAFINSLKGEEKFPNSMKQDLRVLNLLYDMEESSDEDTFINLRN